MKIGIITIQNAINYGATLQTLALQEYLKSMGHDVFVVDYQNPRINSVYRFNTATIKEEARNIFHGHVRSGLAQIYEIVKVYIQTPYFKVVRKYDKFCKKNITFTDKILPNQLNKLYEFEALICGSDQVWNYNIVGNDVIYYLDIPDYKGKSISYAASGFLTHDSQKQIEKITKLNKISVREESMKTMLEAETQKEIEVVCDPTLLFEKSFWDKLSCKFFVDRKYIFVYAMWEEDIVTEYAKMLGEKLRLPVVVLNRVSKNVDIEGVKFNSATPAEFLGLVRNAEYVISNSFHGTVFSIIFHKKFMAYNSGSRIHDLLKLLKLENRMMEQDGNVREDIQVDIDWAMTEGKLDLFRASSMKFLEDALI